MSDERPPAPGWVRRRRPLEAAATRSRPTDRCQHAGPAAASSSTGPTPRPRPHPRLRPPARLRPHRRRATASREGRRRPARPKAKAPVVGVIGVVALVVLAVVVGALTILGQAGDDDDVAINRAPIDRPTTTPTTSAADDEQVDRLIGAAVAGSPTSWLNSATTSCSTWPASRASGSPPGTRPARCCSSPPPVPAARKWRRPTGSWPASE